MITDPQVTKRVIKTLKRSIQELTVIKDTLESGEDYHIGNLDSSFIWCKSRINKIRLPKVVI